ncbi:hypothetical protein DL93DRAFT_2233848 [Clavulina sp. PMI_390]|nr:hypothetical protein DL93DRAFT_2233848 [Clavulina sp. PMI_390]
MSGHQNPHLFLGSGHQGAAPYVIYAYGDTTGPDGLPTAEQPRPLVQGTMHWDHRHIGTFDPPPTGNIVNPAFSTTTLNPAVLHQVPQQPQAIYSFADQDANVAFGYYPMNANVMAPVPSTSYREEAQAPQFAAGKNGAAALAHPGPAKAVDHDLRIDGAAYNAYGFLGSRSAEYANGGVTQGPSPQAWHPATPEPHISMLASIPAPRQLEQPHTSSGWSYGGPLSPTTSSLASPSRPKAAQGRGRRDRAARAYSVSSVQPLGANEIHVVRSPSGSAQSSSTSPRKSKAGLFKSLDGCWNCREARKRCPLGLDEYGRCLRCVKLCIQCLGGYVSYPSAVHVQSSQTNSFFDIQGAAKAKNSSKSRATLTLPIVGNDTLRNTTYPHLNNVPTPLPHPLPTSHEFYTNHLPPLDTTHCVSGRSRASTITSLASGSSALSESNASSSFPATHDDHPSVEEQSSGFGPMAVDTTYYPWMAQLSLTDSFPHHSFVSPDYPLPDTHVMTPSVAESSQNLARFDPYPQKVSLEHLGPPAQT